MYLPSLRIGFGFDTHQLKSGLPLFVGGVEISSDKGAVGHSDADVLVHAICDALLGAVNLGDLGTHFPDTHKEWENIPGSKLLSLCYMKVVGKGFLLNNIDSTVCLEEPKLNPYVGKMQGVIAKILEISEENISIKATTGEKLGFLGRKEGVSAYATALLIGK